MYWLWSSQTVKHILKCIVGLGPEVLSSLRNQGNSEPFLQTSSCGESSDTKESNKLDVALEVTSVFVGRGLFPAMYLFVAVKSGLMGPKVGLLALSLSLLDLLAHLWKITGVIYSILLLVNFLLIQQFHIFLAWGSWGS